MVIPREDSVKVKEWKVYFDWDVREKFQCKKPRGREVSEPDSIFREFGGGGGGVREGGKGHSLTTHGLEFTPLNGGLRRQCRRL